MKFEDLPTQVQTTLLEGHCTCASTLLDQHIQALKHLDKQDDKKGDKDEGGPCAYCRALTLARDLGYGDAVRDAPAPGGIPPTDIPMPPTDMPSWPTTWPFTFPRGRRRARRPRWPAGGAYFADFPAYFGGRRFDPRDCSCHPDNGGSGMCGCTLGGWEVWCGANGSNGSVTADGGLR